VLTSFKSIIREAQSRGLVVANVAASVSIQTAGNTRHKEEVEIPQTGEVRALLSTLDQLATQSNKQRAKAWRRYRALIATAVHTGLRASELRGLSWEAVDLKAGTVMVEQRADENGKIGAPKSATSHRVINIPAALATVLRAWKLECPPGALAFPNWQGEVESLANIHTRAWKPLQLAAGLADPVKDADGKPARDEEGTPVLTPRYTVHALRHFHASYMIADGANPKEVQAEMGHSTIVATYDLYGHLFKDDAADKLRRERAERLGAALA
jgi:integrase